MDETPKNEQPVSRWQRFVFGRNPKRTLIRVIVVVLGTLLTYHFAVLPIRVSGSSMFPTYRDRQIKLVNRLAYKFGDPQRYDVVLVHPEGMTNWFLKRIIGLPGETLTMDRGTVLINNQPLSEPYLRNKLPWTTAEPIVIAPGEYFVVGDNRANHPDSHAKGLVGRNEIIGRVLFQDTITE